MKNFFRHFKLRIIIVLTLIASYTAYSFSDVYFEISKNLDIFSSLYREVNMYYVDTTDPGKLMKTGMDAMLESLDPYTSFIPESEMGDFRFMTTGQYGGIGALIKNRNNSIVISEPYEGYPAQRSGLRAGDIILQVDGKSMAGKRTDEVSRALKGSPKTQVRILVGRDGVKENMEFLLVREEIKVKNVSYHAMLNNSIAYIRISHFTENAGREVSEALKELREKGTVQGVILDLRGNPGGLLHEAVNISNLFIEKGQDIVSTKGKRKEQDKTYKAINSPLDLEVPLAVLVNSSSASASEIVSGSLQDLDRAVIVGARTFGKGLVQTSRPLSYNTQLKITTAKYYIPSGRCIQALDYSNRNEDGSVGKVPDSLMRPFKTKSGRTVYDGGGILPDILFQNPKYSEISKSLLNKNLVFDYATLYQKKNKSIAAPESFNLDDNDFNDFVNYISDKEYDYVTESEIKLEELKKKAEEEKYFPEIKNEYEALKSKIVHNKQLDVQNNKAEIKQILEEEIVSRYYYQKGRVHASLKKDREVEKAIEILSDSALYTGILSPAGADQAKGTNR